MIRIGWVWMWAVAAAYGQTAQFDVASVKLSAEQSGRADPSRPRGCSGGPGSTDPGRWVCNNATVSTLISSAFRLRRYQFTAAQWMNTTYVDVVAKVPVGATAEQLRLMEQNLLVTRFKLAFHYDDKEMPGYKLTIAKDGPKLRESLDDPPGYTPPPAPKSMNWDSDGYPILPDGNETVLWFINGRVHNRWRRVTVDVLADYFADELGGPVTDATNLKKTYDVTLKFMRTPMPIPGTPIQRGPNGELIPPMVEPGPDLKASVQTQLGLKLESEKAVGRIFVVDHMEKTPVEN